MKSLSLFLLMAGLVAENSERVSSQASVANGDPDKYKSVLKKRGVQEFTINGVTVIARNHKNALKKARRLVS